MSNNPYYPKKLHGVQAELEVRKSTIGALSERALDSRKKSQSLWGRLRRWFRRH